MFASQTLHTQLTTIAHAIYRGIEQACIYILAKLHVATHTAACAGRNKAVAHGWVAGTLTHSRLRTRRMATIPDLTMGGWTVERRPVAVALVATATVTPSFLLLTSAWGREGYTRHFPFLASLTRSLPLAAVFTGSKLHFFQVVARPDTPLKAIYEHLAKSSPEPAKAMQVYGDSSSLMDGWVNGELVDTRPSLLHGVMPGKTLPKPGSSVAPLLAVAVGVPVGYVPHAQVLVGFCKRGPNSHTDSTPFFIVDRHPLFMPKTEVDTFPDQYVYRWLAGGYTALAKAFPSPPREPARSGPGAAVELKHWAGRMGLAPAPESSLPVKTLPRTSFKAQMKADAAAAAAVPAPAAPVEPGSAEDWQTMHLAKEAALSEPVDIGPACEGCVQGKGDSHPWHQSIGGCKESFDASEAGHKAQGLTAPVVHRHGQWYALQYGRVSTDDEEEEGGAYAHPMPATFVTCKGEGVFCRGCWPTYVSNIEAHMEESALSHGVYDEAM